MYGNNFFMPYGMNYQMPSNINLGSLGINNNLIGHSAKTGILGRLSGLSGSLQRINWGGLLNNTSRTLNVINQAIPIAKQAGPMFNNMRSMLRLASAFKDETTPKNTKRDISYLSNTSNINNTTPNTDKISSVNNNDNTPNFFIN